MNLRSPIGTIINFCSNDYPFLRHCITAIKPISSQILIPVCDHFFDGTKEERLTLDQIYAENTDVQFLEFPFDADKSFYGAHTAAFWHNLARLIGRFFLKEEVQYALLLDCDEIADQDALIQWLNAFPYYEYDALRLLNYWYFRASNLQAKTWEDTPLLAKKTTLNGLSLMHAQERAGIYTTATGKKAGRVASLENKPLFHHYSWVRTKEQLLRKVVSWSHHRDRDWVSSVQEEFSHPFSGTDFVHGYAFEEVTAFAPIDLLQVPKPFSHCDFSHVRKISHEEMLKIDISLTYQIPICL